VDHRDTVVPSVRPDAERDNVPHAGSADVERLAQDHRRQRWLMTAIGLLAAGLMLTLLIQIGTFDGLFAPERTPGAAEPGDTQASVTADSAVDQSRPFATTPAAYWLDGAAGIVIPEAQAVAGHSVPQVQEAFHQVRDILVVSRLDRRLLVNHDPAAFLAALAPDARRQLAPLFGSGREVEVQSLVSMVDRGHALLPVEPKVTGQMWAQAGDAGELVVHTNYVLAYAFRTGNPGQIVDAMDLLVVVRAEVDYVLRTGARWTPDSQGWWYGKVDGYAYSIACDSYRRGFLAPVSAEQTTGRAPRTNPNAYFDPTGPLPAVGSCPR
jgi:hypothetical protein